MNPFERPVEAIKSAADTASGTGINIVHFFQEGFETQRHKQIQSYRTGLHKIADQIHRGTFGSFAALSHHTQRAFVFSRTEIGVSWNSVQPQPNKGKVIVSINEGIDGFKCDRFHFNPEGTEISSVSYGLQPSSSKLEQKMIRNELRSFVEDLQKLPPNSWEPRPTSQ